MKVACLHCGAKGEGNFCSVCGNILPGSDLDYFALLGLPRLIGLDLATLKNNFYLLSRKFHPDRHAGSAPELKEMAFKKATLINKAYNTLRDKFSRIRYLIDLELGLSVKERESAMDISSELFLLAEEVNEAIFAAQSGQAAALEAAEAKLNQQLAREEKQLDEQAARWDEAMARAEAGEKIDPETRRAMVAELKRKMDEMAYCERMLERIERMREETFYKRL